MTRVITSDSGINRINELFFSKDNNNFEVIRNMFDVSSIIIVILLIIIFMYFEMSKENRRIEFMKMILESIIKEKENDNQIA
ncbi:hypothetical protein [Niallia sp. FSL M8-0099]|uniref:hypothetical protein n=1 Tax=Niallia sp. FSL M8-0099 TaxID=2954519 RepID=UPI00119FAA04